jgi:hypothetical protein
MSSIMLVVALMRYVTVTPTIFDSYVRQLAFDHISIFRFPIGSDTDVDSLMTLYMVGISYTYLEHLSSAATT